MRMGIMGYKTSPKISSHQKSSLHCSQVEGWWLELATGGSSHLSWQLLDGGQCCPFDQGS